MKKLFNILKNVSWFFITLSVELSLFIMAIALIFFFDMPIHAFLIVFIAIGIDLKYGLAKIEKAINLNNLKQLLKGLEK